MALSKKITQLESYIGEADMADPKISRQSVGWHVHHSLKVIHSVLNTLSASDPSGYHWKFNLYRTIFLDGLGWFPRGKAKAPRSVRPPEVVDLPLIDEELKAVRSKMAGLEGLTPGHYFDHPYFGHLKLADAKKFLSVHTEHHLKIIRDILRG